jgi:zinc protease
MTRALLPNGMRVVVRPSTLSPSVAVRLCLQTGTVHDPPGMEGLALATGLMLEEGTEKRSAAEIAETIDFLGAETDVSVDKHSTVLTAATLREDLEPVLGVLAESVRVPVFPARELEKVRGQMLTTLREEEHDTRAVAVRALVRLLYPSRHPYHRAGSGTRRSLAAIGRRDLARFHRERYHPNGSILVLVGDVDPRCALRVAARVFGSWRKKGNPDPPPVADVAGPRRPAARAVVVPEKTQSDVVLGFVGIRRTDPDFHRVTVLNQILGAFGLGGRLGNRIREKEGLAYSVRSALHASVGPGPFVIRAGVHPGHVRKAVGIMREEIGRIREERVRPSELDETKTYLIGSLPLKLETHDGVASFLMAEEYFGLGPDYLGRFRKEIAAVTRDEVRDAARRLLRLDSSAVAVAGPPLPEGIEWAVPGRSRRG